jgi:hypothetical protein
MNGNGTPPPQPLPPAKNVPLSKNAQPPQNAPAQPLDNAPPSENAPPPLRWYHYAGPVVFALFCIELGVLLVLAPWLDLYEHNWLLFLRPEWRPFLLSHQFRGALSGLGFLNFIVALNEFIDLARLSGSRR